MDAVVSLQELTTELSSVLELLSRQERSAASLSTLLILVLSMEASMHSVLTSEMRSEERHNQNITDANVVFKQSLTLKVVYTFEYSPHIS